MLGFITLATSVHLLGSADFQHHKLESITDYAVEPEDDILYTLSEVYLNTPETDYFHSVEHPSHFYFEDQEEDETWLFQPPENSVEIPESDSEIDFEEIEYELDEFDEEMESTWLIDERDDVFDEFDDGWSEETADLSQEDAAIFDTNSMNNLHDQPLSRERDVLSDLKIQFKLLIDQGYLEQSEVVESLMNGEFDHLLEPKRAKTFNVDKNSGKQLYQSDIKAFGPNKPQEIPLFPMPENSAKLFTLLEKSGSVENHDLGLAQWHESPNAHPPICNIESEKRNSNMATKLRPTGYFQKSLTPAAFTKSLVPVPVKKSLELVPDKKSLEPVPFMKSLTPVPVKKSLEPVPDKKSLEPVPVKKSLEPVPVKKSLEPVPVKQSLSPVHDKKSLEPVPFMKSLTPVPDKKSIETAPDKKSLTKYPRPVESPIVQDSLRVIPGDLINIDDTTYSFFDVSNIQVLDLPSIDSEEIESEEFGDEEDISDADQDSYIDGHDDIWQDDNWPEWNVDEDGDLYY